MSDLGRKNFSDKVSEAVTPESQKSVLEKTKESVTNTADSFAGKATPDNQKSFPQTVSDNVKKGHDEAADAADAHKQTLGETATEYVDAAKEQVANAAEYVSSVLTGAGEGAKSGHDVGKK